MDLTNDVSFFCFIRHLKNKISSLYKSLIMTGRLRSNAKLDLDAAVAAGHAPKAGAGGVGLSVDIPGKRPRLLVNRHGAVTPHGNYFFDATGREAPSGFDYQQLPVRSGQRHVIRLLDGTMKAVQIFNPATNTFKTTALGKKYFSKAKDRYTVSFPVKLTSLEPTALCTSVRIGSLAQLCPTWEKSKYRGNFQKHSKSQQ